jgi:hypothetical protein
MHCSHTIRTVFALLACGMATMAWGGPPFRTDDPEAVEHKHAEFYVFTAQTLAADGRAGIGPAFEVNYGVVENVQLHVVAPFAFNTPSGEATTHGYGDTELGVKWQFTEDAEGLPMIGVFPLVELPTGNADKGLGNGHSQLFLPLWIQKKWGDFQTYGGGGYWINNASEGKNYWFAGWQVQYQFSEHVTLGAEVFHATSQFDGQPSSTGFNVGGFYNFDEHNHLLFSMGKGLSHASETNRVSSYLGYQYTL